MYNVYIFIIYLYITSIKLLENRFKEMEIFTNNIFKTHHIHFEEFYINIF